MQSFDLSQSKPIYRGKAKSLYESGNPDLLLVEFRDDATAFNAEKKATIPGKGKINNLINSHIMQFLNQAGVATHFVRQVSPTVSEFRHLQMLPLECVIRNVAAGSLCKRLGIERGRELDPPLFEFFLKNDALGDPLITRDHILTFKWATEEEMAELEALTRNVNNLLREFFSRAGLILVDFKLEFGKYQGKLCLGDEITPDGCRIWDANTKEVLDKDRFRFDLGDLMTGYKKIAEKFNLSSTLEGKL